MQTLKPICAAAPLALALALAVPADAQAGNDKARLKGGAENPPVISFGEGFFEAKFRDDRIPFRLSYKGLANPDTGSDVTQVHLHVANPSINGGITVYLCTNLGNTPPGATVRPCPPSPGNVSGDIVAADVQAVPPSIGAGDLVGLRKLIEDGSIYVNDHTDDFPGGEIRGQINNANER